MIIWENKNVKVTWDNQWIIWYKIAEIEFGASTEGVIQGLTYMIENDKVHMHLAATDAVVIKDG